MKKLSGVLGIAFIAIAVVYIGFMTTFCDGKKIACMDFSITHPVIGLLLLLGSALSAVRFFTIDPD